MLISVNGTIIDTKRIYKIEEIKIFKHKVNVNSNIELVFRFFICFNNTEKLEIFSKEYVYKNYKEVDNNDFINFRDSIIKIWQENQSEIPQFNF